MQEFIVTFLLASSLLQAMLGIYIWGRRQEAVGKPLIIIAVICFTWMFTYAMDLSSENLNEKIMWMSIRFSVNIFIALPVLFFVIEHLELPTVIDRKKLLALTIIPVLSVGMVWTSGSHQLLRYDFYIEKIGELPVLRWKSGPFIWLAQFYANVLLSYSVYLLLRSLPGAGPVKSRQTVLIIIAFALPVGVNILYTLGVSPIPDFNFAPFLLFFSWLALAFAIFQHRLLELVPLARNTLVDIIPAGVIVLDKHNRIVDANLKAKKSLSAAHQIIGQDIKKAFPALNLVEAEAFQAGNPNQEIQVSGEDGETSYLEIENIPLKNTDEQFNGWLIMIYDVTERKKEELRLLQLTQGVEQSPTSVVITNLAGDIEYVNPQFTHLTGYTLEEVRGANPRIVQSGQTSREVYEDMWNTIMTGRTWRGEFLNKKKNGELYWELAVIAPVKDREGQIINFVAIKEDISAQKEAETALRESESKLRMLNRELEARLEKIAGLESELREQAIRDPLTGLYNRRFLNETIEREFERARRNQQPLSIVMIDIDHFKSINDNYGHLSGDACLEMLATLLRQTTRKADIACRFGGEEFLLLMPGAEPEMAAQRAEELRLLFANSMPPAQVRTKITISIGVASYPVHGTNYTDIISKADEALYIAKNHGRNRVVVWAGHPN